MHRMLNAVQGKDNLSFPLSFRNICECKADLVYINPMGGFFQFLNKKYVYPGDVRVIGQYALADHMMLKPVQGKDNLNFLLSFRNIFESKADLVNVNQMGGSSSFLIRRSRSTLEISLSPLKQDSLL